MKKLSFLILFILIPILIFGQVELKGAIGLIFGMNQSSVKGILMKNGGTLLSEKDNYISFIKVPIGTKTADLVICQFINSKLFQIDADFIPKIEAKTKELYNEVKKILIDKYGESGSFRIFNGKYEDGASYEMQAIATGNESIATYWSEFKIGSNIALEIKANLNLVYISLIYQDGLLMNEVERKDYEGKKYSFNY
jgi:hypothetical protein